MVSKRHTKALFQKPSELSPHRHVSDPKAVSKERNVHFRQHYVFIIENALQRAHWKKESKMVDKESEILFILYYNIMKYWKESTRNV